MTGLFGCQTIGIVYLATCSNCKKQYVGQTNRRFYDRMMEHLRSITNGTNALGEHYLNSNCESKDLLVQVIEKVLPHSEALLLQRESFWIHKLDTQIPYGLNSRA